MKNRVSFLLLLALFSVANCEAADKRPDFTWQPGTVEARVKFDEFRPEVGQYLYISHQENEAEQWNMAKLNLPESWKIKSVTVDGLIIHVATEHAGEFAISPDNLKKFRSELLKEKNQTDERLAELWRAHALAAKKP